MQVRYTESFPTEEVGAGGPEARREWRLVRQIVEDRLAREVMNRLRAERQSDMA